MKSFTILMVSGIILLCSSFVSAQNIIYTMVGEIDGVSTSIDSIAVENLTNGTYMGFGNLPILDDYRINLTQKSFWGSTAIHVITKNKLFFLEHNQPGSIVIGCNTHKTIDAKVSVYNINGQTISSQSGIKVGTNSYLGIKIGIPGIYFITVSTNLGTQTFKATGYAGEGDVTVSSFPGINNNPVAKSISTNYDEDFFFNTGDSLKILIFKSGYVAQPIFLKINGSESFTIPLLACYVPEVTTLAADSVTTESAVLRGKIVKDGICEIIERGFYWSKINQSPGVNDNKIVVNDTASAMRYYLDSLELYATCYFVAFARNSEGISLGNVGSFTPGTFVDTRDNHLYKTVKIGRQTWMAENLAYLPMVVRPKYYSQYESYYYVQGYDGIIVDSAKATANYKTYGVLYNWPAAMNGLLNGSSNKNPSGVQGVCPAGWHLPSKSEWEDLLYYLTNNGYNYDGTKGYNLVSKAMAAQTNWKASDVIGSPGNDMSKNNSSGFSALPGGYCDEAFWGFPTGALWWSSTKDEWDDTDSYYVSFYFWDTYVQLFGGWKLKGYGVRCVKDK